MFDKEVKTHSLFTKYVRPFEPFSIEFREVGGVTDLNCGDTTSSFLLEGLKDNNGNVTSSCFVFHVFDYQNSAQKKV